MCSRAATGLCRWQIERVSKLSKRLGECLTLTQVDQDQQGLPARVQSTPGRTDCGAMTADHVGQ